MELEEKRCNEEEKSNNIKRVVSNDDILDLIIDLNLSSDVEQFIKNI